MPIAALLGAYWLDLEPEPGDQCCVAESERLTRLLPLRDGRAVMVAVAAVTVVAAVVAAMM
ncbi:hypothetical protein ACFYZ8_05695 [Streptomyces sp. NPDC001668]|uniref:hypothetical protein n=1 Tax=unclassified Streptomyces TaxID=2593676 RepID=UPI0036926036